MPGSVWLTVVFSCLLVQLVKQGNCMTVTVVSTGAQVIDSGSTLSLTCVVSNATNVTRVEWNGPAGPLNETSSSFNNSESILKSTLVATNVTYEDGGVYMCNFDALNNSIFIAITPTILPVNLMTSAGNTTSNFTCNIQSSLASSIVWYMYDSNGLQGEVTTAGSGSGMVAYMDTMLDFMIVMFADAGLYQCAVNTSELGEVRSNNATLTVLPGELMVNVTPSNILNFGENVSLSCSAMGGPDNMFQWQKDGADLPGENQVTLQLTQVNASDGGVYTCVVSNAAGNDSISETLYIRPYFTVQPMSIESSAGENQTLTCMAEAFPEPTIEWFRADSGNFSMTVTRMNTSTLMFTPVQFGDEGGYYCTATSNGASINSSVATLSVLPGELMLNVTPLNILSLGDNVTLTCSANGGPNNMFQWQKDGVDLPGENQTTLQLTRVSATDGGEYTCVVSNAAGSVNISTTLYIRPYFTLQPMSVLTEAGQNSTLYCEIEGFPEPAIEWFRVDSRDFGENVTGMNTSTLMFTPVQFGDEGDYYCTATSNGESTNSTVVTLTVAPGELTITVSSIVSFQDNVTLTCSAMGGPDNMFQWQKDGADLPGENLVTLQLTQVNASNGGEYTCVVSNAAGNDSISETLSIRPYFTVEPMNIESSAGGNQTLACMAEAFPEPTIEWFRADGGNFSMTVTGMNTGTLMFTPVQFGDEGGYYCTATSNGASINSSVATLSVFPGELMLNAIPSNILNFGDNVTLTCSAMGGPDNMFQWQKDGADLPGENQVMLQLTQVNATDGGVYTCVVSNAAGNDSVSETLYIRPYFTVQPMNIESSAGENQTLFCMAEAFPELAIEWFRADGGNFSMTVTGMNTSTLMFTPVQFGDEGDYYCTATSNEGSTNSSVATLTVLPGELMLNVTPSSILKFGDNVTLTCSANGGPDNMFQWQKDGADLPGENQTMLQLTLVNASDGGDYTCVVSNAAGSVNISTTLYIRLYFTVQPMSVLTEAGQNSTLSCEADGFPEPAIEWFRVDSRDFGENVTGMNTGTLMFAPVQFGDEGDYYCTATSNGESTNSTVVTLTVSPGELMLSFTPLNIVSLEDNVTLTCSAMGGPDNMFQWQKNGADLPGENLVTLQLTQVNASDGGVYTCVVSNAAGNDSISETLYIRPYFTVQPMNIESSAGGNRTLTCMAEAFPEPTIEWFRADGGNFSMTVTGMNTSTLMFTPVQFGDEGDYYCTATSNGGSANSSVVTLTVSPAGSVMASPENINSSQGDNPTFSCTAQGGPGNMFSWTRLYDNATVGNMSSLTVSVEGAEDGGMYRCEVTNQAGSDSATITLNVGPVIDTPPMSKNTSTFDTVSLTCVASGFPVPSITWLHNDTEFEEDNRTTVPVEVGSRNVTSTLTIRMAMVNDSGEYICNATSPPYDPVSSDPALVFVQNTPEQPQNVTAVVVTTTGVVLEWVEPHDNNAPILGYRISYTRPLFLDGLEVTVNSSVERVNITGLHPGFTYIFIVIAFNELGDSSSSDGLMVTTIETAPTAPPENISIDVLFSTEIRVSWEEVTEVNRRGVITQYEVMYEPLMTFSILTTLTVNTTNLSITLMGLEEYVEYNISVRAYTSVGPGPYSVGIVNRTFEDAPASPPQNVTATVLSSTKIQVDWTEVPEIDQNGGITQYEVMYEPLVTFGVLTTSTVNTTNLSITLMDLEEYVEYNISVRAYTSEGPGPFSEGITRRTFEDAPASSPQDVITLVLSSTEIEVNWKEVMAINQNGIVTEYEVRYEPLMTFGGELMTMTEIVDASNLSITLMDLEEYVEYNISVRAYTSVGPGPYSVGIVNRTFEDAPASSPQDVITLVLSSTDIEVNWKEVMAIEQNGIVTEYEVRYEPLMTFGGELMPMMEIVDASNLSITLMDLEEYVEYNISVRAYTSVGPGPYSMGIVNRTFENTPASPPQNVAATVLSSTEIRVDWTEVPEIDQNGIITQYEVMYEPLTTFGVLTTRRNTTNASDLYITLTGLEEYVEYNISVRAYTSVGPGPYSVGIVNRTFENTPASPPQNVAATVLSSTEIRVDWTEVTEINQNGIITQYEVMYEPLMTFGVLTTSTVNTTNLSITLMDLEEYVEYNISVRAYTSEGPGPYSVGIVNRTSEDVPASPPQNVIALVLSSTEIQVNWTVVVPERDRNGIITQYEVMYELLDQDGAVVTNYSVFLDSNNFTVIISELEEFMTYNISVRALTSAGPGPYSVPEQTLVTLQGTPGPLPQPTPPPPENISANSAPISWSPPPDANGIILTYTVNFVAVGLVSDSGSQRRRRRAVVNTLSDCIVGGEDMIDRNLTVPGNQTSATLMNLTPNTVYGFRVQAVTEVGEGDFTNLTTFSTMESVPSEPRNLTVTYRDDNSTILDIEWTNPLCDNGIRRNYSIDYFPIETDGMTGSPPNGTILSEDTTTLTLTDLSPNTAYNVSIRAWTLVGPGEPSSSIGMTNEDAPPSVTELIFVSMENNSDRSVSITLSWTRPSDRNGPYSYEIAYNGTQRGAYAGSGTRDMQSNVPLGDSGETTTMFTFSGLPSAEYTVIVTAINTKTRLSNPATMIINTTIPIAPTSVRNLTAVAISSTSILVKWDLPEFPNGRINTYTVNYREESLTGTSFSQQSTALGAQSNEELMISGLTAFTNYTIFVVAVGMSDLTSPRGTMIVERTNATIPTEVVLPTDVPTSAPTTGTIMINLPMADFTTGPLKFYGVVVDLSPNPMSNLEEGYPGIGPYMAGATFYIAGAWDNPSDVPAMFTVGDGTTTTVNGTEYRNVPLNAGTSYALSVRVEIVSDNGEPLITYSGQMTVTTPLGYSPAGVAIGVLLLLAAAIAAVVGLVLGLLWYRRRYYFPKLQGYEDNDLEFEETPGQYTNMSSMVHHNINAVVHTGTMEPIPVSQLKAHVMKMHSNDDYLFSEEYANVEPSHSPTTEATHYPPNAAKNRYANIPCYDHSRVRLAELPNRPGSDYINANYIDGYHQPKAFIASQGPVPDSVGDFWRMVWEQGSATVVMLTNLQEKGRIKCHKYWPDDRGNLYGNVRVHIQEVLALADYTVRTFSIQKDDSKEERIITQFHYTVWPDHGVPDNPTPLLHFVRKVASSNPTNAGPIVVHCSAGVGRTGTFISIFSQLRQIRLENKVDIFGFVRSMRYNRCCMVQTELQYVFIHDALLEAIECGVHEVAARDLKDQYKKLGILDGTIGLTRLEIEYDNLEKTVHRRPTKTVGTLQINKFKNRYPHAEMLPYDATRCRLSFIPGVDGSDYINANVIHGYHKRSAFIGTQAPLPDTSDDFWRMMWEKQSATIVMLTREREGGKVKCHRYWPNTGAENFGSLQVILHSVTEYPDYTLRELKIVDVKDGSSLPVKQFQYTGWPEEGVPDSGSGLIDLIGQVQKWQRSSGDKPIVVHCSGGTGRTGVFIAVSVLLERLKTEGVVDVFHTVRGLRLQRPGLVHTTDQYEFVYKTVLEYLDSFELYDNFK